MTAVSVCITWSRPDDEHARGLCTNTLQLETQPPEIDKPLPCYVCVNPVSPGRVEGCRQCADWDTNDKLVRYIGQATDPEEVLPNAIEFELDGSIGGTVGAQLITQTLGPTHPLSKSGTRYLYTPVLQPGDIKTSGMLRQLSAFSALAADAWELGAEIKGQAASAEAAELAIENDNSCLWGLGEFWTHSRAYAGPRGYSVSSFSMLQDNVHYECSQVFNPEFTDGYYLTLSVDSRPLYGGHPVIDVSSVGVLTEATASGIVGFEDADRTDPSTWKWPADVGDLFSLVHPTVISAAKMFPFWRGSGSGSELFGLSGFTASGIQEFIVNASNYYQDGNVYDYIADLAGTSPGGYSGAGDSASGRKHYWATSDPYDRDYYVNYCRGEFSHRFAKQTGKATVGYRWNLYNHFPSNDADPTSPGGGGYGTLLRLEIVTPVPNNTTAKIPLWTWCDVVKPGKKKAGYGPGLQVLSNRYCTEFSGECVTPLPICYWNNIEHEDTVDPRGHRLRGALGCVQWVWDENPQQISLGATGCCVIWAGSLGYNPYGPGVTNFDPRFGHALTSSCGIRVNRNGTLPASNEWPALMDETKWAWGTMFWGVDQHNPDVDFKSGWMNWIETTDAEDATVRAQLPTIGRLPPRAAQGPPGGGNVANVLAVYKVTKSLAHCDRKRFDLKLIWARTEAYGCTFDGPKAVPSTYPATGSLFWD